MSAAMVSPFTDFNDILLQQRSKTRSQSVSTMLGMMEALDSRSWQHGLGGPSNANVVPSRMFCSSSSVAQANSNMTAMISQQQGDNSSASCLYNRSQGQGPSPSAAPINSFNGSLNTAINSSNVPSARKLDRSISEPCDRNNAASKNPANINSTRYKTELCRPFEENGYCKYGDKCQFAHGAHEQRSLARHPKYKTELCRTFHTIGFCPYGPRCHFIHNEDERKLGQIIQMKQQQQQQAAAQAALQQAAAQQTSLQQLQSQLQSSSPVNLQRSHSVSPPTPVQRPKTLNFSLSLNMVRDSLGSTADSPPSSFTDSPSMSPNYLAEDLLAVSMALCNTPPASAPATVNSAFTFPELNQPIPSTPTPIMTPLNVQTVDPLASLAAGLQAASLRNNLATTDVLQDLNDSFYTPPSPPDSLNGDSINVNNTFEKPLDVSRGLRLPIFSRLANED